MADRTETLAALARVGATLTWTFDDATFLPNPPPKTPQPSMPLIRFDLTCSEPVTIRIWRTGNTPWREFTVPAGTYQYPSGGPVQNTGDITFISLGTA